VEGVSFFFSSSGTDGRVAHPTLTMKVGHDAIQDSNGTRPVLIGGLIPACGDRFEVAVRGDNPG
jgi:hypothetical protein